MSGLDMSQSNLLVVEGVNSKSQETKGFPPTLLLVAAFFFFFFFLVCTSCNTYSAQWKAWL